MKLQAFTLVSAAVLAGATPFEVRQATNPSATVDTGPLTGTTTTFASSTATVNKFLGIPFGSIPERFEPAEPAPTWTSTFDATSYKTYCVQEFASSTADPGQRNRTITVFNTPEPLGTEGEDCLNLNVFSPSTASSTNLKPVMFWIYGGALAFGASSLSMYDGSYFAANQDVIIVTINYRTNIFGFPGYPGQPTGEQNLG
jgi:carboxylesterase type B